MMMIYTRHGKQIVEHFCVYLPYLWHWHCSIILSKHGMLARLSLMTQLYLIRLNHASPKWCVLFHWFWPESKVWSGDLLCFKSCSGCGRSDELLERLIRDDLPMVARWGLVVGWPWALHQPWAGSARCCLVQRCCCSSRPVLVKGSRRLRHGIYIKQTNEKTNNKKMNQ